VGTPGSTCRGWINRVAMAQEPFNREDETMSDHDRGKQSRSRIPPITRRRFIKSASVAAALPTLMTAALSRPGHAQTRKLPTLVVAVQEGDTRTIDPQGANELTVPLFLRGLYDQMVTFPGSEFGRVVPDIAAKWNVSPDGLTYVFTLNPNVKFSDGTPATADDVVFSLRRRALSADLAVPQHRQGGDSPPEWRQRLCRCRHDRYGAQMVGSA